MRVVLVYIDFLHLPSKVWRNCYMKKNPPVIIDSEALLMREYDAKEIALAGSLLDTLKSIGCPCTLHKDEISPKPFFLTSEVYFYRRTGSFESVGIHGEDEGLAVHAFIENIIKRCGEGALLSKEAAVEKLYRLQVFQTYVAIVPYKKAVL